MINSISISIFTLVLFDLLIILFLYVTLVEFQMEFVKAAANLPNVTVMTEKVG